MREAEILTIVNNIFSEGLITVWLMLPYPLLKLFPHATGYKRLGNKFDMLRNYMLEVIQQHQDTLDEEQPRDYIDVYLTTMRQDREHKYTLGNLNASLVDFFLAGTETSSTTLKWCLLFLVRHPDHQDRCREEIRGGNL